MLVFGGSLGARTINEAAVEAFRAAPFRVLHAAGTRDHAALAPRVDGEHYDLRPYIDDFGEALAACDLCVARAGGSIFEIAAAGKPAILVPYPHASADHQTANARWMAEAGAAVVVPDARADGGAPGQRGRRAARRSARGWRRWRARRRRWRGPTRRRRSPTRCSPRRRPGERRDADERGAARARRLGGRRLHFVGIGGAGMSGLALIADALGATVTGLGPGELAVPRARARGGDRGGRRPRRRQRARRATTSSSSSRRRSAPTNPERAAARERGLREIHRGALLGELSRLRRTIAIAGTHGKTTTASMAAHALLALGWDPTYVIGGELRRPGATGRGTNAAFGTGEWLVVEADESDRSFLELAPEIAVVTNIELDHHTTYASHAELELAFAQFLRNGLRSVVADTPQAEAFLDRVGIDEAAFFGASEIELSADGSRFVWAGQPVALSVPGAHNVANAAAALTACVIAGARPREVAGTLADFAGAGRRFERLGAAAGSGALVVDDYAHHPTELRATIAAARTLGRARVVAVFQPHLFSRTQLLAREFGAALAQADAAVVLDVYPSRERAEDFPGVTGMLIAEAAADAARGRPVAWAPGFDDGAAGARRRCCARATCASCMGAGDVDELGRRLVAALKRPAKRQFLSRVSVSVEL